MEQSSQNSSQRRHRKATYIAPQDSDKTDPFAPVGESGPSDFPVPETPAELDGSIERQIIENIPPHFGSL